MLDNKTILITGGTGSFGKKFVQMAFECHKPKKIIIYSRDEYKQFEFANNLAQWGIPASKIRFFIGDVRDKERLISALEGVDIAIHAAAMKQVPAAEYNPFEAIKTNVIGAQNVIEAALHHDLERVVALSTDKAAGPINLYGATKLCSDKLFVAANSFKGKRQVRFSVVRYGNVMGSRGSVIPFFTEQAKTNKSLTVTHNDMTRFNITLKQGVDFTFHCLQRMWGGEVFIPKIPSYRITDVAEAVVPHGTVKTVGIRPGEKLHEEMITHTDALSSVEFDSYYVILPSISLWDVDKYLKESNGDNLGKRCEFGFSYSSGNNKDFLSADEIRYLINNEMDA